MRILVIAACFAIASVAAPICVSAQAAPKAAHTPHELTPQQQKMKDCNAQAKEKQLKGKERKQFMSNCLKAKSGM